MQQWHLEAAFTFEVYSLFRVFAVNLRLNSQNRNKRTRRKKHNGFIPRSSCHEPRFERNFEAKRQPNRYAAGLPRQKKPIPFKTYGKMLSRYKIRYDFGSRTPFTVCLTDYYGTWYNKKAY